MKDYKTHPLEPGKHYHVFNRANGNESLFSSEENYRFFLERYRKYTSDVIDTLAYCLMPNHFHFIIRVRPEQEVEQYFLQKEPRDGRTLEGFQTLRGSERQAFISRLLSLCFSHFLNSYAQAYNKQERRKGSLFMHPFKRKHIGDTRYLRKLIHYIHWNPVEARLTDHPSGWTFSSYNAFISHKPTSISRGEVLQLFDSVDNFIYCHSAKPALSGID